MRPLSVCLMVMCLGALTFAAAPPGRLPAEVSKWIEQLGSDDDDTRAAAQKKLEALEEAVLPVLRQAAKKHADVDVRLRAAVVVAAIEKKLFGELRTYTGHVGWVYRFVLTPDGKKIVSSGDYIRV